MKIITPIIVSILFLFSINTLSAQNNNGSGYGRKEMNSSRMSRNKQSNIDPEKSREESVKKIVDLLKVDLNLDELQVIAISNIFMESQKIQGILMKKESSDEDKIIKIQSLSESTDLKVMDLLNKDQKIKYNLLREERKNRMQSSSQRRNRN